MQWFKQKCELAGAIFGASTRLQVATYAWIFMPVMVFAVGGLIPAGGEQGPTAMLKPIFDMARSLVPWAALIVFVKFGLITADIYQKEKRRLLGC